MFLTQHVTEKAKVTLCYQLVTTVQTHRYTICIFTSYLRCFLFALL